MEFGSQYNVTYVNSKHFFPIYHLVKTNKQKEKTFYILDSCFSCINTREYNNSSTLTNRKEEKRTLSGTPDL